MAGVSCGLHLDPGRMRLLPMRFACMGGRNRGDGGQRQPEGQSENCGRLQMMHEVDRGEAVQSLSSVLNPERKSK